jgi:hypothetical protein
VQEHAPHLAPEPTRCRPRIAEALDLRYALEGVTDDEFSVRAGCGSADDAQRDARHPSAFN